VFDSVADWKQSLNPAQLEAVTCDDGPVLVIAGAGTGKTWTLACRVAYLIEQGVPPERILLLTFSRRAAREMLSRAGRLVELKRAGKVWGGTFHEAGANLVREGTMTEARYNELTEGMRMADDDQSTLVAHARMHQLVARKPEPPR